MKKAKLMLSAIAVFAVMGGAFAFKASRDANIFFAKAANGQFSSQIMTTLTTDLAIPGPTLSTYLSTSPTTATTVPTLLVKRTS